GGGRGLRQVVRRQGARGAARRRRERRAARSRSRVARRRRAAPRVMPSSQTSLARSALSTYRRRRAHEAQLHPRLAFYSPLPPAATGVATYGAAVLDGLRWIGFTERRRMD